MGGPRVFVYIIGTKVLSLGLFRCTASIMAERGALSRSKRRIHQERLRSYTRVVIGDQYEKWCDFKKKLNLESHQMVARMLLER